MPPFKFAPWLAALLLALAAPAALLLALAAPAALLLALAAPAALAAHAAPAPDPRQIFFEQIVVPEIALGADQWRVTKLQMSLRRHQDLHIRAAGKSLHGFIAWPSTTAKVPVVLMIAEDQGLNNWARLQADQWARLQADQIAAMGYIVVVPDLLSGLGPKGGDRDSFPDLLSVMWGHAQALQQEPMLVAEMNGWADYAKALPQSNRKLAVVGFAWGGGRAVDFATQRKDLGAVLVFYDAVPKGANIAALSAPLYGFYAEHDPRVLKSLPGTKAAMAAAGKPYQPMLFLGADHMFVRLADDPRNNNPANIIAAHQSMARLQQVLAGL